MPYWLDGWWAWSNQGMLHHTHRQLNLRLCQSHAVVVSLTLGSRRVGPRHYNWCLLHGLCSQLPCALALAVVELHHRLALRRNERDCSSLRKNNLSLSRPSTFAVLHTGSPGRTPAFYAPFHERGIVLTAGSRIQGRNKLFGSTSTRIWYIAHYSACCVNNHLNASWRVVHPPPPNMSDRSHAIPILVHMVDPLEHIHEFQSTAHKLDLPKPSYKWTSIPGMWCCPWQSTSSWVDRQIPRTSG